jgi:hypothetical protein
MLGVVVKSETGRVVLTGILVALAISAPIRGDQADEAMIQTDLDFVRAVVGADKSALENLVDADFIWTDSRGNTQSRAAFLENPPKLPFAIQRNAQLRQYTYGGLGDVQANLGRIHTLRVWAKRPAGWKAIVYQEVMSLDAPPSVTPGAGKDCENPCQTIPFKPMNETERQVAGAYSRLETAAMAHNSPVFATLAADEFVAASSNSNKIYDKRGRMDDFDHAKMAGVAPTPLISARMFDFGDAVLMVSEHTPDRGKPLHVARVWVKRNGNWMETVSYQTSVQEPTVKP